MSNGSVIVVGGINGAGGASNPTLEVLPRTPGGSTVVFFDWLAQTNPNNLYPFLHVLPSGRLFVGEFVMADYSNFLD